MFYDVRDAPGLPGTYCFQILGDYVLIPGHGGDRDGPTIPDHPEQLEWMRAHSGLRESWHLQWDLPDLATRRRFLELLGIEG
jgi:hypothetical protein